MESNKPKTKIRAGDISLTEWENEKQDESGNKFKIQSYVLEKNYKNKAGEWKNTSNLNKRDLPKAIALLTKAYTDATITTEQF